MRPMVNRPKPDPATDTGNMHKKIGKDGVWFWRYPGRQTDRQTYSSQYFAPSGELINQSSVQLHSRHFHKALKFMYDV